LFTISTTFSVDTPSGAVIQVNLPSEVSFDTTTPYICKGTLNLR